MRQLNPLRMPLFALALAALLLALACSGDDGNGAPSASAPSGSAPSATPKPAITAEVSPTPLPPGVCTSDGLLVPCPTPVPPHSHAWLIDVRDGSITPVFDDPAEDVIRYAEFDGDEAVLGVLDPDASDYRLNVLRFDLDGNEVSREPWPPAPGSGPVNNFRWFQSWLPGDPICSPVEGGVEIDGDFHPDVSCGPMSPDGRWMIYRVDRGPTAILNDEGASWDEWLVDLDSDQTIELQTGLEVCLGDSFFNPTWSPSSRYVVFGDCAQGGRVFLGDTVDGTARVILNKLPAYGNLPDWSRARDLIVYRDGSDGTVLEDLDGGPPVNLGLPWPARFDTSGRYVYAAAPGDQGTEPETVIFDTETLTSTTLPGEALYRQWPIRQTSVAGTQDSFVAALSGQLYCAGMTIYVDGSPLGCLVGAEAPNFSPDGKYVALSLSTTQLEFGGVYDIAIVELATGRQQVVLKDVLTRVPYPYPVAWNDESTHILVRSPQDYGPTGP